MSGSSTESALVKPVRNFFGNIVAFFGAIVDAAYYFVDSLIHPSSGPSNNRRITNGSNFSGPRGGSRSSGSGPSGGTNIHTLRSMAPRNAPNMNIGGCRSCM